MWSRATSHNGSGPALQLVPPNELVNPALLKHARDRAMSFSNRLTDRITAFSASMKFVLLDRERPSRLLASLTRAFALVR